jgi:hypothetical protein
MRGGRANKCGSAAIQGEHRLSWLILGVTSLVLAAVAVCVSSRAHAGDGGSAASRRMVLSLEDLDRVTAGSITIQINADASARGATAFASALTTFEVTYGQALKVQVEPSEAPRPMHLVGLQELAVTRGKGQAYASGDQGADCSVSAIVASPDLVAGMMTSEKLVTAITTLCQCQLVTISLVH